MEAVSADEDQDFPVFSSVKPNVSSSSAYIELSMFKVGIISCLFFIIAPLAISKDTKIYNEYYRVPNVNSEV